MNLPPFVYVLAFWEALSYAVAGILWLLVLFGVISPSWALTPSALLALFLAILKWFDIVPQLKAKAVLKEYERMLLANKEARELRKSR